MPFSLNAWNSYVVFSSPKFRSYHYLLSVRSYKSTPTQTLFGSGRSGAPLGGTTTSLFCLLSYEEDSFPPKQRGGLFL